MKNIKSLDLSPADFLKNINRLAGMRGKATQIVSEAFDFRSSGTLNVLWDENNEFGNAPFAIVASKDILGNLLPRIIALPGMALPVSAFIRTWQKEDFIAGAILRANSLNEVAVLGFVGLVIAELKTAIGPEVDLSMMGMDSVRRTLSFVCAQSIARGWSDSNLDEIINRWLEARVLTENDEFSSVLMCVKAYSGFLERINRKLAVKDLREGLATDIQSWIASKNYSGMSENSTKSLINAIRVLKGLRSRESRYDIVIDLLTEYEATGESMDPLEHGFLLSLIEPGSLDFLDLAQRSGSNSIAISTAYCMFTTILGGDMTLGYFSAFGWNIIKNSNGFRGEMPFDISLSELRILHDARRSSPMAFRTRSPSLVDVELAPYISASFGNPARRRTAAPKSEEMAIDIERREILQESVAIALNALEAANKVLKSQKNRSDRNSSAQRRIY